MRYEGFIGGAYTGQSLNFDCQDLINWYVERAENPAAKTPQQLLPVPGFSVVVTLPYSPVRGLFAQNDRAFAVAGEHFYELFRNGTYQERTLTTLADPSAPVITNSAVASPLVAPDAPVITHGGSLGATTYGYKVTALNDLGETEASVEGTSALGNATLSATNYAQVGWTAVTGATGYKVYRTTGGALPPVIIATVAAAVLSYRDIGSAGASATPPVTNTTGGTAGATTWGYKISALLGTGETVASGEGVTAAGQVALTATDYNVVTWVAVPNAHGYKVYRTTGGASPPVLIETINDGATLTTRDFGVSGTPASPPTANSTGTAPLTDDGTTVSISSSGDAGNQLLIVSGGSAYAFDLTDNTFAQVLVGATRGGYIGGYFVVLDASISTMRVSELLDGFAWDPAQVYQRVVGSDRWLSIAVTHNEIWLTGSQTSEVWVATGDDATRFAPYQPVFIEQGIMAPASLDTIDGKAIWLTQNSDGAGMICLAENYEPIRISTHAIEHAVQGYTNLADAVSWSYQQEGHTFYVLTFPTDDATWVYDTTTKEWHKRGYFDPNLMHFTAYRPQCHAFAWGGVGFGQHLVGDRSSGRVCRMSLALATDVDGAYIRRVRRAPHLFNEHELVFYRNLLIEMQTGMGLATGQGSDPTAMLRWSDDGGITWSNEHWKSAGPQGQSKVRVRWNRLGSAPDRVFEYVVTDPVPFRLSGAFITLGGGAS